MSVNRVFSALWLLSTGCLLILPVLGIDETTRLYYSNACQVLIVLVSALFCFGTARAFPSESALGKVWGAIGGGTLAWAIGAAIFAAYPLLHENADTPFPYFSDIGYLLAPPLIAIGVWMFKRSTGLVSPMWGKALAIVALFGAAALAYHANAEGLASEDPILKLTAIGYTAFDPILLSVTLLTASAFRSGDVGASWWYVVAGILLYYLGNVLYNYLVLSEQYKTGSPIDASWLLGFGLIACGAVKAKKLLG